MKRRRHGFSLVELVIVVVIIGILAAIAVPRISRGARGASDGALRANLAVFRAAITLYSAEHGGNFPAEATFEDQMIKYSDLAGGTSDTRTGAFIFGPYIKKIPPLPVGAKAGKTGVVAGTVFSDTDNGWVYDNATGSIMSNTADTELSEDGITPYNTF